MKPTKIFVAGGTGFVGKRLIKILKRRHLPFVTTSQSSGIDFRNFTQTLAYFKRHKPDVLIHTAAYVGGIKFGMDHAGEMYYNNVVMSAYLIESARLTGVKRLIFPISNCAYPDVVHKDFKEDEFWDGQLHHSVMPYGMARKAQWVQTWAYNKQYGIDCVNLILPNMYGPGDYFDEERSHALGAILMKIARAKENGTPEVVLWGTGKPVREWLYVDDGAEALVRAIALPKTTVDPVNVGVGKGISIRELAQLIQKIVGYKGKLVFDTSKPDGAPYKIMNNERCKQVLGWVPSTPIEDGIRKTYEDYIIRRKAGEL